MNDFEQKQKAFQEYINAYFNKAVSIEYIIECGKLVPNYVRLSGSQEKMGKFREYFDEINIG